MNHKCHCFVVSLMFSGWINKERKENRGRSWMVREGKREKKTWKEERFFLAVLVGKCSKAKTAKSTLITCKRVCALVGSDQPNHTKKNAIVGYQPK